MKFVHTIILAAAILAIPSCGSEPGSEVKVTTQGGPMLSIDKEVHNFGTLEFGADASCIFTVSNTGDQPLIITECKKTCGCTVPECSTDPIPPGKTSEIKITYDSKKAGVFNKMVKVYSNSLGGAEKHLRITGEVLPDKNAENQQDTKE
jgi:Protein of unknown function (DUF1573)